LEALKFAHAFTVIACCIDAPTPRIDKLASEGMRLLNFNVEAQCTPSRAALMTGRSITSTSSLLAIVSKGQSIGLNFAKKF